MQDSRVSPELHCRLLELTLALYRVTDFFPQDEALRRQLREKANQIFGSITEYGTSLDIGQDAESIISQIQSVKAYLGLARALGFARPVNFTVLEREYDFWDGMFQKETEVLQRPKPRGKPAEKIAPESVGISAGVNERQQVMIEHLKKNNQAKISDFQTVFSGISSKTIQRDLQDLVAKQILHQQGKKRWRVYTLKK